MLTVFTEKCDSECMFQNTSPQSHQQYRVRERMWQEIHVKSDEYPFALRFSNSLEWIQ